MRTRIKKRWIKIKCNLKEIRHKRKITQNDISNELKIRQTTVSEWENGNAIPNLKKAYELAEYLRVRVTDIWE